MKHSLSIRLEIDDEYPNDTAWTTEGLSADLELRSEQLRLLFNAMETIIEKSKHGLGAESVH
jgi:hypothetical protein